MCFALPSLETKTDAVALFGSQARIARALEISRPAVSQWPEQLPRSVRDRLLGAALRHNLVKYHDTTQASAAEPATPFEQERSRRRAA